MVKTLFASDLHGNHYGYEHLFRIAQERGIDAVILGGDLTPKKLALRLKDKESKDGEIVSPGEIIPVRHLEKRGPANTYTAGLKVVDGLNRRYGPTELGKILERQGYIINPVPSAFFDFEEMLEDNSFIDELQRFLSLDGELNRSRYPLNLTQSQKEFSLESIVSNLINLENTMSETKRQSLAERWKIWTKNIKVAHPTFEMLAMSKNLPLYILMADSLPELRRQRDRLLEVLDTSDSKVAGYIKEALRDSIVEIEVATALMQSGYDDKFFIGQLADGTTSHKLSETYTPANAFKTYTAGQKAFIQGKFREELVKFRKTRPEAKVYAILGNDDISEVEQNMRDLHDAGLVTYLDNQTIVSLGKDNFIVGYPFVVDSDGRFYDKWEKPENEISSDLEKLKSRMDSEGIPVDRTIFVIHTPAYGGELDMNYQGRHIGSKAVGKFIRDHSPLMVLSGHVHESYTRTGQVMERVGVTPCYNPGANFGENTCTAVIVDTEKPTEFERINEVGKK